METPVAAGSFPQRFSHSNSNSCCPILVKLGGNVNGHFKLWPFIYSKVGYVAMYYCMTMSTGNMVYVTRSRCVSTRWPATTCSRRRTRTGPAYRCLSATFPPASHNDSMRKYCLKSLEDVSALVFIARFWSIFVAASHNNRSHWDEAQCLRTVTLHYRHKELLPFIIFNASVLSEP